MNTITATSPRNESKGAFARLAQTFVTQLRRAIELSGAPYVNGPLPPL
jgi:hypothetical protein